MTIKILKPGWSCDRGAAAVEFALVAMPLFMMFFGLLELGYRIYVNAVMNGALQEAARMATTGQYTGVEIDDNVKQAIRKVQGQANIDIVKRSYSDFTGVGLEEPVTSGSRLSGTYCFQDINENSQWDADQGRSGLGNADDVVYYEVKVRYETLFPFSLKVFGLEDYQDLKSNTIVSNEPYAPKSQKTPVTKCVG